MGNAILGILLVGGFLFVCLMIVGAVSEWWEGLKPAPPPPPPPPPTADELIFAAQQRADTMVEEARAVTARQVSVAQDRAASQLADTRARARRYADQERRKFQRLEAERMLASQKSGWE